tara:strand:+ start:283 stop:978 length:696 start_codon:yes stop_codon:yes gene_type:complete
LKHTIRQVITDTGREGVIINMSTTAKKSSEAKNSDSSAANSNVRKGRPRSEKSKNAILKATNNLLLHMSVQELSIEAIAKKAKVGKTTIYRWWPNKTAVVMDALINQPGIQSPLPTPKNNTEAVVMQLDKLIRLLASKNGATIAQLFSEAQGNDKARKVFTDTFIAPMVDAIEFSIQEGIEGKEFRRGIDTKMAVDILVGPIFFRLLANPDSLDDKFRDTYPKEAAALISA